MDEISNPNNTEYWIWGLNGWDHSIKLAVIHCEAQFILARLKNTPTGMFNQGAGG